jgi:hypothetical protein
MATHDQRVDGWRVVLRRQPARMVEGRAEGGYTDTFEIICCGCGDHPGLDYREISPGLQRVRGALPDRGRYQGIRAAPSAAPAAAVPHRPGRMTDAG